jgi:hypothetical protein
MGIGIFVWATSRRIGTKPPPDRPAIFRNHN